MKHAHTKDSNSQNPIHKQCVFINISASKQTKKRNYVHINKRPLSCTFKQVLKKNKTQLHLEKGELGRGSETRQKEKVIMSTEKEQRSTHISKMQPSLYS